MGGQTAHGSGQPGGGIVRGHKVRVHPPSCG
jgi:hypothetical protein